MSTPTTFDDILETFSFLEDWEDRYKYIIDLGRELPPMDDALKTDATRVRGCTSQVWMVANWTDEPTRLSLTADSDAHIVRGLIAVLLGLYQGKTAGEILATNAKAELEKLGLQGHLSPMRTNGLYSMVERIQRFAAEVRT